MGEVVPHNFGNAKEYEPADTLTVLKEVEQKREQGPGIAGRLSEKMEGWANLLALPTEQPDVFSKEWYEHFARNVGKEMRDTIPIVRKAIELLESRDILGSAIRSAKLMHEVFDLRATVYEDLLGDPTAAEHNRRLAERMKLELESIGEFVDDGDPPTQTNVVPFPNRQKPE
jgi:hypothetical protein